MRHPLAVRLFIMLILVGVLPTCGPHHQIQSTHVTVAPEGWRAVSLPFRPINITSVGDTLWVCGADEMMAKSDDGGQTWQVKHQKTDGEVLLNVGLSANKPATEREQTGWFSGRPTAAKHGRLEMPVKQLSTLLSRTTSTALGTHVLVWKSRMMAARIGAISMAFLDAKHAALALNQTQGENIFLFTVNGGRTWKHLHIDNTFAGQLVVHGGEYWAFGIEYVEREKGGGYSVPVALHSANGEKWVHGVRAPTEFTNCTSQGCVLYDGAIADLYHEKPVYLATPADGSLTPKWAAAKQSVCTIGSGLKCASAKSSEAPPPRPEINRPISQSFNPPAPLPGCLICGLDSFPVPKDLVGRGVVDVDFVVRKDGTVADVQVTGAPAKEIEPGVADAVRAWIFEPPRQNGVPIEKTQSMKLGVMCFAFPTSDEGTCSLRVVQGPRSKT